MVISLLIIAIATVVVGASLPFIAKDGSPIAMDRDTFINICPLH
tara:strand:+ start:2007 stop:2138 length:132 start_codon:yes stop_codon:yes gene_type:complete